MAPTSPRRQQPRTPAPTPELTATQKWWAAFMGDRAFARARAAGKNATEAGHARAKAEADMALVATSPLTATQKWAAFMGDRAFAKARAAGKNATEAGHARAKAEADIALSLPAEYRD